MATNSPILQVSSSWLLQPILILGLWGLRAQSQLTRVGRRTPGRCEPPNTHQLHIVINGQQLNRRSLTLKYIIFKSRVFKSFIATRNAIIWFVLPSRACIPSHRASLGQGRNTGFHCHQLLLPISLTRPGVFCEEGTLLMKLIKIIIKLRLSNH